MAQLPGRNALEDRLAMKAYILGLIQHGDAQCSPESVYLLGFDKEKVDPMSIKTYIRRLWLAFESGRGTLPRRFLDPRVEEFVKREINKVVNELADDPRKLAAELSKDSVELIDEIQQQRGFLEGVVDHILITREWGDELWGHRRECRSELANSKPEPGQDTAPVWPQDKDRISLAVRQWIAAQVQERVRDPRHWKDKRAPAISCPEDPEERRAALRATIDTLEREDSPDRTPSDTEVRPTFGVQIKQDGSASPPPQRSEFMPVVTAQSETPNPDEFVSASQPHASIGTKEPCASRSFCSRSDLDTAIRGSTDSCLSLKRKRGDRRLLQKRSKVTKIRAAQSESMTPSQSVRERRSSASLVSGTLPCEDNGSRHQIRHHCVAASGFAQQIDERNLHGSSRDAITPSATDSERSSQAYHRETIATNLPLSPISRDSRSQHVLLKRRYASADRDLGVDTAPPRLNTRKSKTHSAGSQRPTAARHQDPMTQLRSASPTQVFLPATLLAASSSVPAANLDSPMARPISPPISPTIENAATQEILNDSEGQAGPTNIEMQKMLPPYASRDSDTNKEQIGGRLEERGPVEGHLLQKRELVEEERGLMHGVLQSDSTEDLVCIGQDVSTAGNAGMPEPSLSAWDEMSPIDACFADSVKRSLEEDHEQHIAHVASKSAATGNAPVPMEGDLRAEFHHLRLEHSHSHSSYTDLPQVQHGRVDKSATLASTRNTDPGQDSDDGQDFTEVMQPKIKNSLHKHWQTTELVAGRRAAEESPEFHTNTAIGVNATESDIHVSLQSSGQTRSSLSPCLATQATDAFLEGLKNDDLDFALSTAPTAVSSMVVPTQGELTSMKDLEPHSVPPQYRSNAGEVSFDKLTNTFSGDAAVASQRTVALPATTLTKSLSGTCVEGNSTSSSGMLDCVDLPLPKGASSIPPKCRRCTHSLMRPRDVVPDNKGIAQWKLRYYYCRFQEHRPSPCPCHHCSQLRSEKGQRAAGGHQSSSEPEITVEQDFVVGEVAVGPETNYNPAYAAPSTNQDGRSRVTESNAGADRSHDNAHLACSHCMQGEGGIKHLLLHVLTKHNANARVVCLDCNFESEIQEVRFAEHLDVVHHFGKRTFSCPTADCETAFSNWQDLRLHYLRFHNGAYICGICGITHEGGKALKRHQEQRGEKEIRSDERVGERIERPSSQRARAVAAAQLVDPSYEQPYVPYSDPLSTTSGASSSSPLPLCNAKMSNERHSARSHMCSDGQGDDGRAAAPAEPYDNDKWLKQLCDASHDTLVNQAGVDDSTHIELTGSEEYLQAEDSCAYLENTDIEPAVPSAMNLSQPPALTPESQVINDSDIDPALSASLRQLLPGNLGAQREHEHGQHTLPVPQPTVLHPAVRHSRQSSTLSSGATEPRCTATPIQINQVSSQYWTDLRIDALRKMIHSLESIIEGDLGVNHILDYKIPRTEERCAIVAAEVGGREKVDSILFVLDALRKASKTLRELRDNGFLPVSLSSFTYRSMSDGNSDDRSVYTKLERLNKWFVGSMSSFATAEVIRKLALCWDLSNMANEVLFQDLDTPDQNSGQGLIQAYEREREYLVDAFKKRSTLSISDTVNLQSPHPSQYPSHDLLGSSSVSESSIHRKYDGRKQIFQGRVLPRLSSVVTGSKHQVNSS